jgi:hypothetical protein
MCVTKDNQREQGGGGHTTLGIAASAEPLPLATATILTPTHPTEELQMCR